MNRPRFDPAVIFVTDPGIGDAAAVERCVAAAVRGGVTAVQLRDKHAADADLIVLARRLKAVTAAVGVPLFINDRVPVVEAADADGVHLGQDDVSPYEARRQLATHRLVGLSITATDDLGTADPHLVDYCGVGPIFATATKPDAATPIGFGGLAALVRALPMPCVAIGRIDADTAAEAIGAGAAGVAVVSAIAGAGDPESAARHLVAVVRQARVAAR